MSKAKSEEEWSNIQHSIIEMLDHLNAVGDYENKKSGEKVNKNIELLKSIKKLVEHMEPHDRLVFDLTGNLMVQDAIKDE